MQRGRLALQRGDFEAALPELLLAEELTGGGGDTSVHYRALLGVARAEAALGEYPSAERHLRLALSDATQLEDDEKRAHALLALGGAQLALGDAGGARQSLLEGEGIARSRGLEAALAVSLNDLGNLEQLRGNGEKALELYLEAADAAPSSGQLGLRARSLANAARSARADPDRALSFLADAEQSLQGLEDSHPHAQLRLNLASLYRDLASSQTTRKQVLEERALALLQESLSQAERLGDARGASHALGILGEVHAEGGRSQLALESSRRALRVGRDLDAHEISYRWHTTIGRLLAAQGDLPEATDAYRRAVGLLQRVRDRDAWAADLSESSFDQKLAPIYHELVDLLLRGAAASSDSQMGQSLLVEARGVMENFKAAELRDYFRDDCVDAQRARTRSLENVSSRAAVIYPILLEERLVLLLGLPGAPLEQFSVPVARWEIEERVGQFRVQLERQATRRFLPHGRQLYAWLLGSLEDRLAAAGVETLVFVPDGPLLTIPMAALHDGEQFLIEKFSLAITPGLDLIDPAALGRSDLRSMAAGISQAVAGETPLPNVADEIRIVGELLGSEVLLDADFQRLNLRASLEEQDFGIVHIATHAQFSATPEETFLLTWDGPLNLDDLADQIGLFRFRDQPLELLTLSACETARGGQRAALGLSGVAVKAGARSVLGSLWSVNDPATTVLVEEFYRALLEGDSRARALQRAQRKLLADFRYRHPAFWAPYLLIGTWL